MFYTATLPAYAHLRIPPLHLICVLIGTARSLAADAAVVKAPFELVTYPGVNHDFIKGGMNYKAAAYKDAFDRTAARLKVAFGD